MKPEAAEEEHGRSDRDFMASLAADDLEVF
jgi:hypothetical protein